MALKSKQKQVEIGGEMILGRRARNLVSFLFIKHLASTSRDS